MMLITLKRSVGSLMLCAFLFLFGSANLLAQEVTGTVTGENGQALQGATVLVKGTTTGSLTDASGTYKVAVSDPQSAVITISYIGYTTQEIAVNGRSTIDISMEAAVTSLDEVVVTGYTTTKKANLTGSVGQVSAKAIEARPITSTSQALQGQVSGVFINQTSGEPGADGATIRIRGIGTLNNPNPYILVDGVESDFNSINPNDIESITVLKDAASAAIFGAKAANGVILITTKRGANNEKPSFTYTGYVGTQNANNIPDYIWDSGDFMRLRNEALTNLGRNPDYPEAVVAEYDANGPNTNWFDAILRPALIQQHNVSMSGGSDKTNFYLSVGYLDQEGIIEETEGTKRYNGRFNIDSKITNNFKLGLNLSLTRQESNLDNVNQDGGVIARATRLGPNFPAYDSQGRLADRDRTIDAIELSTPNILAEVRSLNRLLETSRMLGTLFAEWEVIDGLTLKGTIAGDYNTDNARFFNRRVDMFDWRTGEPGLVWWQNRRLENQYTQALRTVSWLQATYEKTFGATELKVLAGASQEANTWERFGAARTELPSNSLPVISTGNPETSNNYGGATENSLRSFFGRVNVVHDNKYLLELNFRRDGSSRFGANNRWGNFPSISAGWVLSQENFLQGNSLINFLKIRASWGQLGNDRIGDYPFASGISFGPSYNFGGAIVGGAAQNSLGNPDIKWETTTTTNIGVNVGLMDSRLNLEFDYFIRNTSDILFDQSNPGVTGVRTPTTLNIAEVENRGWELSASYIQPIGDLTVRLSGNLTNVNSEVIQIDPNLIGDADRVFQGNYILQRGQPLNALFGLEAIGIFQSQSDIDGAPDQSAFTAPQPGDLQYRDANGDGVVTIDDRVILGKEDPSWLYSFTIDLEYKGFSVVGLFQGIGDVDSYETGRFWAPFNNSGGVASFWRDRWTPSNPSTTVPRLVIPGGVNYNVAHSWFMNPRDYFRMKNLQIGYTLPASLFENNFLQNVRVYVNGQNLFTVSDYLGFDPERPARETNGGGIYPQVRIISGGVNVNF